MKVTREQAEHNRERVLEAAARLFRERGFDGIGVAELMKSVGLTHGGFYGQFGSKEDLPAEACKTSFDKSIERWGRAVEKNPAAGPKAIADFYISPRHVDDPGHGCAAAALAVDVSRQGEKVRQVYTEGVNGLVDVLASSMPERTARARRAHALASFSAMLGAVVLARAVDDEAFAAEILEAVRESL